MVVYNRFVPSGIEHRDTHRAILDRVGGRRLLAVVVDAGDAVACGVGVEYNGYLGLFDIVTDPQYRRQGYGTRLVTGLLDWGREKGCNHVYLQVVAVNEVARRVYDRFRLFEVYRYWYRVPRTSGDVA